MRGSGLPGSSRSKFRLRLRFSRGDLLKFVANNDFIRAWERVFRRAAIPLAYSEGFSPHPRISICAPLPIGMTSEAELMDIFLDQYLSPAAFLSRVGPQLPGGISILEVRYIAPDAPSLQSQVRALEYRVRVEARRETGEIDAAVEGLMASARIDWVQRREIGDTSYDLRALVDDVWIDGQESGRATIGMRLLSSTAGTGRPEQVLKALGFEDVPESIVRTALVLDDGRQVGVR